MPISPSSAAKCASCGSGTPWACCKFPLLCSSQLAKSQPGLRPATQLNQSEAEPTVALTKSILDFHEGLSLSDTRRLRGRIPISRGDR